MIFDKLIFRQMGDCCISVEVADEYTIPANFRLISLHEAMKSVGMKGVLELNPQTRTLGVVYDQITTDPIKLYEAVNDIYSNIKIPSYLESRIIHIPVLYGDPWTDECARTHGVGNNLDFLAERNGVTKRHIIEEHQSTDWWVAAVGFIVGVYIAYPVDEKKKLSSTQYSKPRTWTPIGTIVIAADGSTNGHSVVTPGGSQMIGRTPIALYDPFQRNAAFKDSPILTRITDRHRYRSISLDEYKAIEEEVKAGTYEYRIDTGKFFLEDYFKINQQ